MVSQQSTKGGDSLEEKVPRSAAVRGPWLVGAALVVATLAVYAHACDNEFVNCDDPQYVTDNPHVRAGLSLAGVRWAFLSTEVFNWHPVTWLSLQLDAQIFGQRAWGFHLTNVTLHAANTFLLFLVFRLMTGAVWRSAATAALFALHPLHVESVAWVAERKDLLSACFGFLALWAYQRYVELPNRSRYWLVFLALALSLMAKPMLVTLPLLLVMLDFWPLRRPASESLAQAGTVRSPRYRLLEKIPLLVLAAAVCALTVIAQRGGGAVVTLESLPLEQRIGNAGVSYVRYLAMAVWPVGLAALYPHPGGSLTAGQVAGAWAFLIGITAVTAALARRRPYLLVGWLWYLGTLVPVIGLVQVGDQALADRYTYVPLVGIFLMVVWGLADVAERWIVLRRPLAAAAAAALIACAALTWMQTLVWRDSRSLWEQALRTTSDNYVAEANLGGACLFGKGTPEEAEEHLRASVRINPRYASGWSRLGLALDRQGKLDEAARCYSRSLELDPRQGRIHNNLAVALAKQGELDQALPHLEEAVRLAPELTEAQYNLAFALARVGRLTEAVAACRQCLRAKPANPQYHETLADLLHRLGDDDAATAHREEAARLRRRFLP